MEDVIAYKGLPEADLPEANVLLVGPVGAGKSSFYNTVNSIFRDRITQRAGSGSAEQSLTTSVGTLANLATVKVHWQTSPQS